MTKMQKHILGKILILGLILGAGWGGMPAQAQEFNCTVSVDYSQVSGSRYTFLDDLIPEVAQYINSNTWTEDRFEEVERIECSMQIIIQEALSLTSFRAQLVVSSRRPIYGTSQNTIVLQLSDPNWMFDYYQGASLSFNTEQFHPLTSMLDFYAYVMLGYDYDTFSELGGTDHFRKARRIIDLAQGRGAGWEQIGRDEGRWGLVAQLLDPRFQPLRKAYYTYHYNGLDRFVTKTDESRKSVLNALSDLKRMYDELSRQYILDVFFSTKYNELTAIFKKSREGGDAYALLSAIDASHLTQYNTLLE